MSSPAPIDANKLKSILSGAKAVMNKVESGDYTTGNVTLDTSIDGNSLVESSHMGGEVTTNNVNSVAPKIVNNTPVYRRLETSKMPAHIKKAMMEQPIPQLSGPNHTFNLDDVEDLLEEKPIPQSRQQQSRQSRQPIRENIQQSNDSFTVSESTLIRIIEDVVEKKFASFMTESYNKNLTEQAIKRTINTLIKEGKIKTKTK